MSLDPPHCIQTYHSTTRNQARATAMAATRAAASGRGDGLRRGSGLAVLPGHAQSSGKSTSNSDPTSAILPQIIRLRCSYRSKGDRLGTPFRFHVAARSGGGEESWNRKSEWDHVEAALARRYC